VNHPRVAIVKPPLTELPDILTQFRSRQALVQPWRAQKKSVIDPLVGNCWPGDNLSLGYLASFLRAREYEVILIDAYLLDMDIYQTARQVLETQPEVVGISILQTEASTALDLVCYVRNKGYSGHIVLGSYFPTFTADYLLSHFPQVDSVVRGEGEETLYELCEALRCSRSLKQVLGLSYRDGTQVIHNEPRPPVMNLDSLPFPDRDCAEIAIRKGYVCSVASSRGCDWCTCLFCCIAPFSHSSPSHGWRSRSIDNLIAELRTLQNHNGLLRINFTDENFLPTATGQIRALEFSQRIINAGLHLDFLISARVNSVNSATFAPLKTAGLSKVFIGVESGVPRILEIFRKGHTPEEALQAVCELRSLGLDVFVGTIMFDPFSSFDEVVMNYEFFTKIEEKLGYFDFFRYSRKLQVYAGTPLRHRLLRERRISENPFHADYPFSDPRIQELYRSIIFFQELVYPFYDLLGRSWECDAENPRWKQRAHDFATIFHQYMREAISCSVTSGRESEAIACADRYLEKVQSLAHDIADPYI